MKIEWRSKAHQDALGIVDYTDIANPIAAFAVYEEIQDQIGFLSKNPHMGRPVRVLGTRELIINRTPFIAAYLVMEDSIIILRVLHGAQRWPKKLSTC